MNLMFWKKKTPLEESGNSATDETIVATETGLAPAKPGFWARLKSTLIPSRNESKPEEENQAEPSAGREGDKRQDEESSTPPTKPGFLARLKSTLSRSHKEDKIQGEEKTEEPRSSAKSKNKNPRDEELEPIDVPEKKSTKKLIIALTLLIPLAAGGGFYAATQFFPPAPRQEVPSAKNTATHEVQINGQPAPVPTGTAEPVPHQEPEQPAEREPQPATNATTPTKKVSETPAEFPAANDLAPGTEDIQAQIEAMKKHNQEMQAQIEALKKQPASEKPRGRSTTPREGVLIINGKNAKESAQGLKKIIEDMNAESGIKK